MVDVSIVMITYNHEAFIAQALDSVLMQNTQYEYELIVGEDCSTDGTRKIIEGYSKRFSGRLKPIYRDKNIGMTPNLIDCLSKVSGRYVAFLEGDDFWTDPLKLEKQARFLDEHSDFAMVVHNWSVIDINGEFLSVGCDITDYAELDLVNSLKNMTEKEYAESVLPLHTTTIMSRNIFTMADRAELAQMLLDYEPLTADTVGVVFALKSGKLGYLPDNMSTYRFRCDSKSDNWISTHAGRYGRDFAFFAHTQRQAERLFKSLGYKGDGTLVRVQELCGAIGAVRHGPAFARRMRGLKQSADIFIHEPHKKKMLRLLFDRIREGNYRK